MSKCAPNIRPCQGWQQGNHWATAHRCMRCGLVAFRLYDPDEGHEGNLQCVELPEGWTRLLLPDPLCPKCAESFAQWMKEGTND